MGDSPSPINGSAPPPDTDGGLASNHAVPQTLTILAAPATAAEFNVVRAAIIPVGCWRLEDLRFEFDSSILRAESRKEFAKLRSLIESHPGAPISLFGHADPVGEDVYNKALSGRRAEVVFATLTRKTEMWEAIYNSLVQGTGDVWKYRAIQVMLKALGHDPGPITGTLNASTKEAVKSFQSKNGLKDDGDPGPGTRGKLFPQYMDFLAGDLKLTPADFLGKGAGPDGKADFQGCGEFNPVMLFSKSESASLESNKEKRNAENAPNRRVMALLFRPGTKIDPAGWPCPTTKEGKAGCEKRFWSDAATRRQFGASRRTFDSDKDTFACRFYHRLMVSSPCEGIKPVPIPIPLESVKPLILPVSTEAAAAPAPTATQNLAPAKESVSPSIGPGNLVAIVERPYTKPNRAIVLLKTDKAFDGKGTFNCSKPTLVEFFRKGSTTAIQFGKDNVFSGADLTKGIELEAKGLKPSGKMNDIELSLALSGGSKKIDPPAKTKMTSVELLLDICEPRTSASSDPPVLTTPTAAPASGASASDKFFGGRPLPLQFDNTYYDERAILIVRKVKPDDFKTSLVLKTDDDKVKLFAAEKPTKGEAALTQPQVIDPTKIPDTGQRFFVEGAKESVVARDTGVRLGVQGVTDVGDRVAISVCHTEIVSNRELSKLKLVAQVPEKPARTTKSPTFLPPPLIVGLEYDIELRPHIELAKMSAFAWSTPSTKINLSDADKEISKLKAKTLSAALDDVELDVLLTTDIGKLKKKHKLTCVRVEMNSVGTGKVFIDTANINVLENPSGCVILTGSDASDATKVPKYEITKIEPNLTWTDDDDRISWWIVGGDIAGAGKYDGRADFRNADSAKRGTKVQIVGSAAGDILIQPYSGGFGYGMFRANVVPIRKVKYRLNRVFTNARAARAATAARPAVPAQAAQPAFPGTAKIPAQPAVPDLPAVGARPALPAVTALTAHAPTASHTEALRHIAIANIYLRQAGFELIPDDSAEVARPARTARPALPAVAAQPAITAQVATPEIPASGSQPAVDPQPAVPARAAIPDLPAVPEVVASAINPKVGQAALDPLIETVTLVSAGHFDVEVNDMNLTFNANGPNQTRAIRINARNEVVTFAYIESSPGTALATALLCPVNHAPLARANPPRAYTVASYTLTDNSTPSSSLIAKTGIPPDVPVDPVRMNVLAADVSWQGSTPVNRDVNLLWGIVVATRNIDNNLPTGGTANTLRQKYGYSLAHEMGHMLGLGHRGTISGTMNVPDGLSLPVTENLMFPFNVPPTSQNVDIIQVKALRFSEIMFRNP